MSKLCRRHHTIALDHRNVNHTKQRRIEDAWPVSRRQNISNNLGKHRIKLKHLGVQLSSVLKQPHFPFI